MTTPEVTTPVATMPRIGDPAPSFTAVSTQGPINFPGDYSGNYFFFHIDVPDGISEFTIRQSPLPVPEPGAALLLGLSAAITLRRKR